MRSLVFAILWAALLFFGFYKYQEITNQFRLYNELTAAILYSENIREEYEFFQNKNHYNHPAQKKFAKELYVKRQKEYKIFFLKKAREYWKVQFTSPLCDECSIADNVRLLQPFGYLIQGLVKFFGLVFILIAIQTERIKIVFKTE